MPRSHPCLLTAMPYSQPCPRSTQEPKPTLSIAGSSQGRAASLNPNPNPNLNRIGRLLPGQGCESPEGLGGANASWERATLCDRAHGPGACSLCPPPRHEGRTRYTSLRWGGVHHAHTHTRGGNVSGIKGAQGPAWRHVKKYTSTGHRDKENKDGEGKEDL